jgi:hypothetical protein
MLPEHTRQAMYPWTPAAYCVFISVLVFLSQSPIKLGSGLMIFFCFLPMVFIFVGAAIFQMQKEIRELRKQVGELEDRLGVERPIAVEKVKKGRFQFSLFELLLAIPVIAVFVSCLMAVYKAWPSAP